MHNAIAIIPARSGSKRIKNKNIRQFHGKPIIAYSIELALKSGFFERVIVSTDSQEIADIARSYGAEVPFLRTAKNADDFATIYDVINEVHDRLDHTYTYTCCLFSTAPLLKLESLSQAVSLLSNTDVDCVFTITPYKYPIQRALKISDEKVEMIQSEHLKTRSQDLMSTYHDAGMMYFYKTEKYLKEKSVFKMISKPIVLPESMVQDIDDEDDWKMAEIKYQNLHEKC